MKRSLTHTLFGSSLLLLAACSPKGASSTSQVNEGASAAPESTMTGTKETKSTTGGDKTEPTAAAGLVVKKPDPIREGLTRQPYLQMATPNSIKIVWRQQIANKPVVKWGDSLGNLSHTVETNQLVVRQTKKDNPNIDSKLALHSAPTATKQFEATISGLNADSRYYYSVEDSGKVLASGADYYFTTQPVVGTDKPLTIWVAGDGGTGGRTQAQVHTAAMEYVKKQGKPLDMFLHVGDMAYQSGLDSEFQGRFFEMYGTTLRNTVCWSAMGNHEGKTSKGEMGVGPYYDAYVTPTKGESGGVASGREAYYSYDHGNVHFVVLDSCQEALKKTGQLTNLGNEMMAWLKEDLEQAKADWLVAFFHHPPYTKGSHDSDSNKDWESIVMRQKFLPLLEAAGVDLVLSGHSHIYERTHLIRGAYHSPSKADGVVLEDGDHHTKSEGLNKDEGTVYIVTGNAGTSLKRAGTIPFMREILLEWGSVVLHVDGNNLKGVMVNHEGKTSDVFEMSKKGKLSPRMALTTFKAPPAMPKEKSRKAEGVPKDAHAKEEEGNKGLAMPAGYAEIVKPRSTWKYHVGDAIKNWEKGSFDDGDWPEGITSIGYGDDDDQTDIEDQMEDKESSIYIRHTFEISPSVALDKVGLGMRFDDGFVAYINGVEVARKNLDGEGDDAKAPQAHEADKMRFEYFPLKAHASVLKHGKNVIAIQGTNDDIDSSDFTLSPMVVIDPK
jgi:acid phosphatase type 7